MDVRLVTPLGLLFALTALVPLAVLALRLRRLGETRRALGLEQASLRSHLPLAVALAAVPALLGLAAAQPVLETTRTVQERTDVQAFVVLDVSRSMLASQEAGAPTRLERAKDLARTLRGELPEVPFGIASLTDRVLPHLFPTSDARVFDATLERAVRVENPPPAAYATLATKLGALREIPEQSYFPPTAKKRVVVVLTDGESEQPEGDLTAAFEREPRIRTVFVRVWGADEAIYETGVAEGGYEPDPRGEAITARAAELIGGEVVGEDDPGALLAAVRGAVGTGETVARSESSGRLALMPWLTLASLVPLLLVLFRRNFWWSGVPSLPRRPAPAHGRRGAKVSEPRGVAQPG